MATRSSVMGAFLPENEFIVRKEWKKCERDWWILGRSTHLHRCDEDALVRAEMTEELDLVVAVRWIMIGLVAVCLTVIVHG